MTFNQSFTPFISSRFLPRAIFGAPPSTFVPQEVSQLNSSFMDAIHAASSALDTTSPQIRFYDEAQRYYVLNVTAFPLSDQPLTVSVQLDATEKHLGDSQVVWPWWVLFLKPFTMRQSSSVLIATCTLRP